MRRTLILPAVGAVCALEVGRRSLWLLWPILTTARALLQPKLCNEADWPA